MQPSVSRFIELESIPMAELVKMPAGTMGVFIPATIEGMTPSQVRQRISAAVTARGSRIGTKCDIRTALVMTNYDGDLTPSMEKYIIVTVR